MFPLFLWVIVYILYLSMIYFELLWEAKNLCLDSSFGGVYVCVECMAWMCERVCVHFYTHASEAREEHWASSFCSSTCFLETVSCSTLSCHFFGQTSSPASPGDSPVSTAHRTGVTDVSGHTQLYMRITLWWSQALMLMQQVPLTTRQPL